MFHSSILAQSVQKCEWHPAFVPAFQAHSPYLRDKEVLLDKVLRAPPSYTTLDTGLTM